MTSSDSEKSLGDDATFAGAAKQPASSRDVSLGDERTLSGDLAIEETLLDDIEIVDLAARYKVEGTLGAGGMGAVVLATDTRLGRKVAIKRILGEAARSKAAIARFLTEARSIAAISHPSVVQIYELGVAKDGPFLVIEYVDGGSLLDRCQTGPIPVEEAVGLVCQVCDGLATAHAAGIVHRDIKPANILLTKGGIAKLTDFGLAKAQAADHQMTVAGAVMGTPDFMPPEQRRDASEVDHRSDIWSLAAALYQAVTGKSPKVIRLHELPPDLQPILSKALEDDKAARYQSAKEFHEALKAARHDGPKTAVPARIQGVLQEGQCKACGTVTSDHSKKFCRNPQCGASLRVPCLKCDAQIPVWDGVCGECGGNQPALLEARRKALASKRVETEQLATDLSFDEAIGHAREIAGESHADLADFAEWAAAFVASTSEERDRQQATAAERLEDAKKHAAACDYPAAIMAITAIPERLRDATASKLLADCHDRKSESDTLIAEIAGRIKRKEINGLLRLVERATELRGDRLDLVKIKKQLQERRDSRVAKAQAAFEAGDARAAVSALGNLTPDELGESSKLCDRVRKAVELEEHLVLLVKAAKANDVVSKEDAEGIIRVAWECLTVNPNNAMVRSLMQQAQQIIVQHKRWQSELADLMKRIAVLTESGKAVDTIPLYKRSLAILEKTLGANHPDTAWTLHELAVLYKNQGKYEQAKPLYERALAIKENSLGPDHPDTAATLNNLAVLYGNQGKYAEAEPLYKRALAIKENSLGPDHPDTAATLNNLAVLYGNQGKYAEAELLHKRAVKIYQKSLGPDRPEEATSYSNLAFLYKSQGQYAEAEPLYHWAIAIRKKALGPDHPETADSLHDLAVLYHDQGQYLQAESLHKRSLAIREKALGPDHPDTAFTLHKLAELCHVQGKHEQAEVFYQRTLAIRERTNRSDHPDTAFTLHKLAELYHVQGKHEQAEVFYQRALAIRERTNGSDHPETAFTLHDLAVLYHDQGKHEQAEPLYRRALAILEKTFGPDHPKTVATRSALAEMQIAGHKKDG